jgi:excinuclease ABC subunit A
MGLGDLYGWLENIEDRMSEKQRIIASEILREIRKRLGFLLDVGIDYLNLNRPSKTLSGGESQRIRLATQIGSKLVGVLYILDEPSIGLHQRDNERLIKALQELRNVGNSVIVVEHNLHVVKTADWLVDLGPEGGAGGGAVIAIGTPEQVAEVSESYTGHFLAGMLLR